jgi:NAD(P)-dependent dehydrogenase (short-subunit alcohol dehydrogenase family)
MSRWVLITGAAKRLGRAIAEEAADRGWSVAIHHRASPDDAESLRQDLLARGVGAVTLAADLEDGEAASQLPARAIEAGAFPLVAVVNSAAIFEHDLIETMTAEAFHKHMRINALAPCLIAQSFARALPTGETGVIVNIQDYKLAQPYPDHFTYTLSKYALLGATEMLARALAPAIRVNAIAPGYVLPAPGQAEADFQRLHAQTPLARGAGQADIAQAALYLMESPILTAQTIYVDAGLRFIVPERDFAFR